MARACTVCVHPERPGIDRALVDGRSSYDLAGVYGLSHDAITRHTASHLPEQVAKARQDADVQQALDVVKQLRAINMATLQVLNEARQAGQKDLMLRAVDRVQRQIELQAKLLGELDERPQVNMLLAPEWVSIRGTVLSALAPFPEARTAVAAQLLALEGSNGHHG
jgi:hypothetical protein